MPARIQKLTAEQEVKIDYTDLIELMAERHHTRESVGMAIGKTGAAFGRYLGKSLPMPGEIVVKAAKALGIHTEEYGHYFYNGHAGANQAVKFENDELIMMKMLLIFGASKLPQKLWDDAQDLRRKIEQEIEETELRTQKK